jgi:cytochrome P450
MANDDKYRYPIEVEFQGTDKDFDDYFNGNYEKCLIEMAEKYPDECTLKHAQAAFVFLNSVQAVNKFTKTDSIANRPQLYALDLISHHYLGSFFRMFDTDLEDIRRTTAKGLQMLVFSNPDAESNVFDELLQFIDFLEVNYLQDKDMVVDDVQTYFQQLCTNIVVAFGLGTRFDYEKTADAAVKQICRCMTDLLTSANALTLSTINQDNSVTQHAHTIEFLKTRLDTIYDFVTTTVVKYKASFDSDNIIKTFADMLLTKQNEKYATLVPGGAYSDEDIIVQVFTVLLASIGTIGFTLTWAFYYLSKNELVQEKIFQEICREAGESAGQVCWKLRSKMVYTEAFVNEVLRLSSTQPLILRYLRLCHYSGLCRT